MTGLALSDEQIAFNDQVDRYLRAELPIDRLHKAFDGDADLSTSLWRGLLDLGLGGCLIAEEFGGLGLGLSDTAGVAERLGFAGAPGPWIGHTLAGYAIAQAGSPEQKSRWLPRLASGETIATVAMMEGDKWRPADLTAGTGERSTDIKDYVLGIEEAQLVVVALSGGGLGLVERVSAGVDGVVWASTDRTRPVGQLLLEDAAIDLMPGAFGIGLLDAALVLIAADSHGGSRRVRDDIIEYSLARVQFDRPIAAFQAVKHKLADLAVSVEFNGALYRKAATLIEQKSDEASSLASLAKAHVTEVFASAARIATESYGGIGYTWEHWAHIWLRRAMFNFAWLGSPAGHRRRAAELMGW